MRHLMRHLLLSLCVLAGMVSCGGGSSAGGSGSAPASSAASSSGSEPINTAAAASVVRTLEVPAALAGAPFDSPKSLTVPPGFRIRLWARVDKARFMTLAPNGDVLVSVPDEGRIVLLRERSGDTPQAFDFATGLRKPQDMVFHTIGGTTYLYVAESNRITRSVYKSGDTATAARQVVVDNLPDSSLPELQGAYGHELKNIALDANDKLYVAIASNCNACVEDTEANPVRGAIYQYDADGSNGRLFARGLRNAEGLDILPTTGKLWVAVNNRDEIKVPFDEDVNGDGSNDVGQIVQAYVDDNPPEPFTEIKDGANYGWPFCNSLPNASMSNLAVAPDYDLNRNNSNFDCGSVTPVSKGIQAHSAPLGLSFLHNTSVPAAYRQGAAIALHGCWNCSHPSAGYKVIYFPFDGSGNPGQASDLVTGFVSDIPNWIVWGRPVDVIADSHGNILISDDMAGAIYQLYPGS